MAFTGRSGALSDRRLARHRGLFLLLVALSSRKRFATSYHTLVGTERGTEWERKAVRKQWAAIERRRASAPRLLGALTLVGGGLVLLLLAVATEVCYTTVRGGITDCVPATQSPIAVSIALLGIVAVTAGLWRSWTAFEK